jgi:rSAM/selenodomain-associated transferase 1
MHMDALVVMVRAPRLGAVKTRLAAEVGEESALAIHRAMTERVVSAVSAGSCAVTVSYTPGDAEPELRDWLGDRFQFTPQRGAALGDRMTAAIDAQLVAGAERVVVIGTDCPTLDAATVGDALSALEHHDVVFGPASDGGYYLVGVRAAQPAIFDRVPWSCEHTLAISLVRAADAGLSVALLQEMRDVDTADDWRWHETRAAG